MISYLEFLGIGGTAATIIVAAFFLVQIVGLILDIKGKAVPMVLNLFGLIRRNKIKQEQMEKTLEKVTKLLEDVNLHYSADNIAKRDGWMEWVNTRAEVYDDSILKINDKLDAATKALVENTRVTEEMFVQTSRDRIIDFANRVGDEKAVVSREEFTRIFKVYDRYEAFLAERDMENGEVEINYKIIKDAYELRAKHHTFIENIRNFGE